MGRYADGRELSYDETSHAFDIGGTAVSAGDVVAYDDAGQIEWVSDDLRTWARGLTHAFASPADGEPETAASPTRGKLFGFRSRRVWKMAIAAAYYALCALLLVGVFASVRPYSVAPVDVALDVVSYLIMVLAMLLPVLLLSDFGYRDKLPLFNQRKWPLSAVGLAIVFLFVVATSAVATTLHSAPYKVAAERERVEQEEKLKAEEQAKAAALARAEADRRAAEASRAVEAESKAAAARAAEASEAAEAARVAEAKKSAEQSQAAAAAKANKERLQAKVISFEKSVYSAEVPAQAAIKKYQATMTRFSKGKASIYEAYSAADDAKSACESARSAYWDIEVPPDVPDDVSALLDEVKSNMSTAYGVKAEAFAAVMEFLDNQKPSSMQEFKDKVAQADSFTITAVAKLLEAKQKVGAPLTAPK